MSDYRMEENHMILPTADDNLEMMTDADERIADEPRYLHTRYSREDFRTWLSDLPPDAPFCRDCLCPIATFLGCDPEPHWNEQAAEEDELLADAIDSNPRLHYRTVTPREVLAVIDDLEGREKAATDDTLTVITELAQVWRGVEYWTAIDSSTYDGAPDAGRPSNCVGMGHSEQAAIEDLRAQMENE